MQKMIADAKLRQNGKWVHPGETFTATDEDAADLVAMKMARKATVVEKVLEAASDAADAVTDTATRRRRPYLRRDMTAENADNKSEE